MVSSFGKEIEHLDSAPRMGRGVERQRMSESAGEDFASIVARLECG